MSKRIEQHFERRLTGAAELLVKIYALKALRDLRESLKPDEGCEEIKMRLSEGIAVCAKTLCIPPGEIQSAVDGAWRLIGAADDTLTQLLKMRLPKS